MNIGFIGAGRVGCSLGKYFNLHGFFVSGYYSRSMQSAETAAELTGSKVFDDPKDLIRESDMIFLTVPDGMIEKVADEIMSFDLFGKTLCHCSGAMSSEVFSQMDEYGGRCSMHPLMAVSSREYDVSNAFFTIEGNEKAIVEVRNILDVCGNTYQEIDKSHKVRYHAAAAVASNLAVGLFDMAIEMLMECGFDRDKAMEALTPLATGNVAAVMEKGPKEALTGPVSRGDDFTVSKHLQILSQEEREIYRLLSLRLLRLAGLPETDNDRMKGILEK